MPFFVLVEHRNSKLKKKKKNKNLVVIQMIHAVEMQMNFVQWNAIDYCPKVID